MSETLYIIKATGQVGILAESCWMPRPPNAKLEIIMVKLMIGTWLTDWIYVEQVEEMVEVAK